MSVVGSNSAVLARKSVLGVKTYPKLILTESNRPIKYCCLHGEVACFIKRTETMSQPMHISEAREVGRESLCESC